MSPKEKGSAAAAAVPKLRRVISKARELPLTVELPAAMNAADGLNMSLALNETKNVAVAIKEVWRTGALVEPPRLSLACAARAWRGTPPERPRRAALSLSLPVCPTLCGRCGSGSTAQTSLVRRS